jgi:hypothetical protein
MGRKDALPAPEVSPSAFFAEARQSGDLVTAVNFLGHALPRHEGVAWAAHALDGQTREAALPAANRQLLDLVLRWADEPTDEHRRAAYESRELAGEESPEALLALAAFFSGGSIAPEELAPVLPAPELSGRLAASAVIVGAYRGPDSNAALNRALDMGDRIAAEGLNALSSQ